MKTLVELASNHNNQSQHSRAGPVGRMHVEVNSPSIPSDPNMCLQAKPSRLHCSHCDETYSLPQNGAIKLYKELRCPLDDFELVLWTSGARGKSYPLCPYCFSNPPFRDMKKGRTEVWAH